MTVLHTINKLLEEPATQGLSMQALYAKKAVDMMFSLAERAAAAHTPPTCVSGLVQKGGIC